MMGKKTSQKNIRKRLTRIHQTYTLADTPNDGNVNQLMIDRFLETLAEISISIAIRNSSKPDSEKMR